MLREASSGREIDALSALSLSQPSISGVYIMWTVVTAMGQTTRKFALIQSRLVNGHACVRAELNYG